MNNLKIDELFTMICEVLDAHLKEAYSHTTTNSARNEVFEG